MAFNNEASKNGYRGTNNQYQQGNKQNKRYDDNTRRNTRNNSGYGTYGTNKYPRDTRRQPKRENGKYEKYDKESYQRNKYHGNSHVPQKYNLDKIQAEETVEDIQNDIARLEKEIRLEIDAIKTIRFF